MWRLKCGQWWKWDTGHSYSIKIALTFGLSLLGWYRRACMRTFDRWVMERGVNRELTRTSAGFSDTCINTSQSLTHLTLKVLQSGQMNKFQQFSRSLIRLSSPHAWKHLGFLTYTIVPNLQACLKFHTEAKDQIQHFAQSSFGAWQVKFRRDSSLE